MLTLVNICRPSHAFGAKRRVGIANWREGWLSSAWMAAAPISCAEPSKKTGNNKSAAQARISMFAAPSIAGGRRIALRHAH
jgi:hypothetical protein